MELPLTGTPKEVINELSSLMTLYVEEPTVEKFCIGITNNIVEAQSICGCDDIIPLYETNTLELAKNVETTLKNDYNKHEKCDNNHESPKFATNEKINYYVCISLWFVY